jgi:pimeloyl-ACP methyl ester carboxylesterase
VPRAGHAVHLERPDEFARVLEAHLEATEAASSSTSA